MADKIILQEQAEKIEKYEKKLRALIQAYKGLLTEKTALEQTLAALNQSDTNYNCTVPGLAKPVIKTDNVNNIPAETSIDKAANETQASNIDNENPDSIQKESKSETEKIAALKNALATLSKEKARQETAFTEDRKRLIDEKEQVEQKLAFQIDALKKLQTDFDRKIQTIKTESESREMILKEELKIREQFSREERSNSESLTKILKSEEQKNQANVRKVEELTILVKEYELRLQDCETIEQLKSELDFCKKNSKDTIFLEQQRIFQLQDELTEIKNRHEQLTICFEGKISDLTSMMCEQEKLRRQDKEEIKNLKLSIGVENGNFPEEKEDPDSLNVDKIENCKELIQQIQFEHPNFDFDGIFPINTATSADIHKKCLLNYDTLQREFELYQKRVQTKFSNKSPAPSANNIEKDNEKEKLKETISLQKNQFKELESEFLREKAQHKLELLDIQRTMKSLKEIHRQEMLNVESEFRRRIADIENELTRQRERTSKILTDKEREIEDLKRQKILPLDFANRAAPASCLTARSESRSSYNSIDDAFAQANPHETSPSSTLAAPCDPLQPSHFVPNYYLSKELARKESELQRQRSDLRRSETQLVTLQHELINKELLHHEMAEKIKDELRLSEAKLARQIQSNESSSSSGHMEYVKNVFMQFALCPDNATKGPMLKAMCLALKLSLKESENLVKNYSKLAGLKL